MKINCIIQARMGSTRLPGKVMKEIGGKPLIGYLIDGLLKCENIDKIVVAIPERDMPSSLGRYLQTRPVEIVLGSEDDVASRFVIALKAHPCEAFVRVCADSPLLQPEIVDSAAWLIGNATYITVGSARGNTAQAFETELFLEVEPLMKGDEREHIGLWYESHDTVVDTPEDFERVKCLILQQQS